jgi:predicted alpha/beta hydrolase family esterase
VITEWKLGALLAHKVICFYFKNAGGVFALGQHIVVIVAHSARTALRVLVRCAFQRNVFGTFTFAGGAVSADGVMAIDEYIIRVSSLKTSAVAIVCS